MADQLRNVTPGKLGCTHILDATSSVAVLAQCLDALQKNGTVLQAGVKPPGSKLEIDVMMHLVNGRRLVGLLAGGRDPKEAVPELIKWGKDGVIPMGKLIREYRAEDFATAKKKMEEGSLIKGLLVWE